VNLLDVWSISPWKGDQPNAAHLSTQDNTTYENAGVHTGPEVDSSPRSQYSKYHCDWHHPRFNHL